MTIDRPRASNGVQGARSPPAWKRLAVPGGRRALLVGLVYILLATPIDNLGRTATLAAIVWPAPAVAVAWLWRAPRGATVPALLAIFVAMMGVGWFDRLPLWANLGFAVLNAFGVWLCVELGRRFVDPQGMLDSTARFTRFLLLLPGIGVMVVALLGGALASAEHGTRWLAEWQVIMGSNGLSMLIIVPGLLEWSRPADPSSRRAPWWLVVLPALCAGGLLVEAFRARLPAEIEHALLALMLVWAAVYGSMRAATLAAFTLAMTGVALTATGNGSYHQHGFSGIRQLQIDLAVLATLVFFVAIALAERRRYEQQLARGHKLESLGMLAGGIAHDFNNVLAAIRGHAEYADELLADGAAAHRPLQQTLAAVHRGHEMTEQMLFAVGRGRAPHAERVSMSAVIDEAVALATPDHPAPVAIVWQDGLAEDDSTGQAAAPDHELIVVGDYGQLVRVLLNLIRNAAQAARAAVEIRLGSSAYGGAHVAVGTAPRGRVVWVDVSDDGPGIAEAMVQQIFEPFFSSKAGSGGHGLGLSIAAGIVTDHRGGIVCGRGALGGASFRVILPAAPAAGVMSATSTISAEGALGAASATTAASAVSERGIAGARQARVVAPPAPVAMLGQGEAVLLVEDDADLRTLLEDWLAELGFAPLGYGDPRAALAALQADPAAVSLIISDVDLPGLSGDALVAAARVCLPVLPAMLISGAAHGAEVAASMGLPFMRKPFGRNEFARAIDALGVFPRTLPN